MRTFAGKTLLIGRPKALRLVAPGFACHRFECVPATVDHALLRVECRLRRVADVPGVRLVVTRAGETTMLAPLPGSGAVIAFAAPNRILAGPDVTFRLLVGARLHPLPAPVRRHPVAETVRAQEDLTALGREVDRLTSRLASQEERTSRLARRHAALIASVRRRRAARTRWRSRLMVAGGLVIGLPLAVYGAALLTAGSDHRADRPAVQVAARAPAPASPAPAHGDIPAAYVARYQEAGRRYLLDWQVLAAVGRLETGHGRWLDNPSGAAGPAQFLAGTWRRYGFDGDTDGRADVYDPDDAIPAMASYLRASGAPENWPAALLAYNHSPRYVQQVLDLAARYRAWRPR